MTRDVRLWTLGSDDFLPEVTFRRFDVPLGVHSNFCSSSDIEHPLVLAFALAASPVIKFTPSNFQAYRELLGLMLEGKYEELAI